MNAIIFQRRSTRRDGFFGCMGEAEFNMMILIYFEISITGNHKKRPGNIIL